MKVQIIAATFNRRIVRPMLDHCLDALKQKNETILPVIEVPGCYEVPFALHRCLKAKPDGILTLGYIEKGETLHGQLMGQIVHEKILDFSLKQMIPVGMGIIGPGATEEQALMRMGRSAQGALDALYALHKLC